MALDLTANNLFKSIATFDPENPLGIPLLKLDKSVLDFGKVSYVRLLQAFEDVETHLQRRKGTRPPSRRT